MIRKCKYITEEEEILISRIASDFQSGNHLLYHRDEVYWNMWNRMVEARKSEMNNTADEKQKEMCEYERQSSDYFYWKRLPEDKKLFVEEEEYGNG